ncbi:uncharacterized protein A1O9_05666 [Exophiala aquamarina CBS 119918]|uniref:CFEM domain-containing protein n=1 Tax=Exophiala aquamarina CBS 119918 TaxID=1182545 RepID=A0A072PD38_9EURO|nr:uncharacterized protein A1O9_05666 [Exophiala aquamarina CBS 119918]KEF57746.1 hypothetical protein A1O9_05666 [Exophiala aquamarina CBS 119918]
MKGFSVILALGLAASTEAARLPLCSAVCLTDAIVATGCKASSTECICSSDVFMSSVTECVEQRCGDDKVSTLETAEQFCSATNTHTQLKKREFSSDSSMSEGEASVAKRSDNPENPELEARGWKGWFGSRFFRGNRNRPHWGWAAPATTTTVTATASQPTAEPKPVDWAPNFKSDTKEWWKQQSSEWWAKNGFAWWKANGWHFDGPNWYSGKSEQWWQTNGNRWWQGPPRGYRGGNWQGGRPWWPSAPAATQTEPVKPTATPTYTPPDNQAWENWPENDSPTGPTVTPTTSPSSPEHTHTGTHPTWTPYTPTKPVQTVVPTGLGPW